MSMRYGTTGKRRLLNLLQPLLPVQGQQACLSTCARNSTPPPPSQPPQKPTGFLAGTPTDPFLCNVPLSFLGLDERTKVFRAVHLLTWQDVVSNKSFQSHFPLDTLSHGSAAPPLSEARFPAPMSSDSESADSAAHSLVARAEKQRRADAARRRQHDVEQVLTRRKRASPPSASFFCRPRPPISSQGASRTHRRVAQQQQQQPQEAAASPTPAAEGSAKGPGGSSSTERGGANELAAAADAGPPALAQPDAHGGASFQASPCANGNKQRGAAQSASAQAQGHGSVSVLADTAAVVAAKALYVVEVTRARASYAEHQQLVNQVIQQQLLMGIGGGIAAGARAFEEEEEEDASLTSPEEVVAALAVEPSSIPTLMGVKDCLDYCSGNWVTMFSLLEGPGLLMRGFRSHWAGARQAGGVDAVEHLEAALQALLALASKPQGMDALLHSPPTLKRLVATLQMAHIDTSLPKLALQVLTKAMLSSEAGYVLVLRSLLCKPLHSPRTALRHGNKQPSSPPQSSDQPSASQSFPCGHSPPSTSVNANGKAPPPPGPPPPPPVVGVQPSRPAPPPPPGPP
eukprot:CAMPEP_0202415826 /NCGR_PEP_ID=MMETSP1128-20130828/37486_1 /ASSEMBLY_ACC=CAM_ASM_000463 /TAXON_ID=3047 /ORGANISM="Dunaliella tertiolecta, Strain CCMP1320" /LENGTH=571 /DNA_ID=CAMNT_0049022631 /DNA_START=73 /DNA_END=1785 /DNA_ORIENTATION=+